MLLPALCTILARHADEPQAAAAAAAALVNISVDAAAARQAVEAGLVETAAAHILSDDADVSERCAMLLANLTNPQHAGSKGTSRLIGSAHLSSVLSAFDSDASSHVSFLLGALTHVLSSDEGRAAILTHPSAARLLARLCSLLAPRSPHMQAAAMAVRNLGFAARPGAAGQAALVSLVCADGADVVSRLALPLAPHDTGEKATGCLYEQEEVLAFSHTLRAAIQPEETRPSDDELASPAVREADVAAGIAALDHTPGHATRLALLEALLLLSAAPAVCEAMRREGIFPVLRESRAMMLLAEDEAHRPAIDANESLVSIFHLASGGQTVPSEPGQPRGKFVWELEDEARKAGGPEPREAREEVED